MHTWGISSANEMQRIVHIFNYRPLKNEILLRLYSKVRLSNFCKCNALVVEYLLKLSIAFRSQCHAKTGQCSIGFITELQINENYTILV